MNAVDNSHCLVCCNVIVNNYRHKTTFMINQPFSIETNMISMLFYPLTLCLMPNSLASLVSRKLALDDQSTLLLNHQSTLLVISYRLPHHIYIHNLSKTTLNQCPTHNPSTNSCNRLGLSTNHIIYHKYKYNTMTLLNLTSLVLMPL